MSASRYDSNAQKPQPSSITHKTPPPPVIRESLRGNPRQPSFTPQYLYGSPTRHNSSYTECRQSCRRENISVHTKLAQANPRSVGSGHHSGLSATSSTITRPKPICQEVKRQLTISFRGRGVEKGAAQGYICLRYA